MRSFGSVRIAPSRCPRIARSFTVAISQVACAVVEVYVGRVRGMSLLKAVYIDLWVYHKHLLGPAGHALCILNRKMNKVSVLDEFCDDA